MGTSGNERPSGDGSGYPYRTPRWVLWLVSVASLVAVGIAFVVGPGDTGSERATRSTTSSSPRTRQAQPPPSRVPGTAGRTSPTSEPSPTLVQPTTTAPTSATPPVTTPPATTPPATAPPATTPPSVPPTTAPAPTGAVVVARCLINGTDLTADGIVTNGGPNPQGYRAHALVVDGRGATVADVSTDVGSVPPGRSAPWTVTQPMDPTGSRRAVACKAGPAEPV